MEKELYIKAIHHHMMVYGAEVKVPNNVVEWYERHFKIEEDSLINYTEEDVLDEVDGFYDNQSEAQDKENSQEWMLEIMGESNG